MTNHSIMLWMFLKKIIVDLNRQAKLGKAKELERFFKTGQGEYGEGDKFKGIMVPEQRSIVKKYYKELNLKEVLFLLNSKFHEFRLTGVLVLVSKYEQGNLKEKQRIVNFYLKNLKAGRINNWDIVDLSAPKILGDFLFSKSKDLLYVLAKSNNLWERRVAILSTYNFIRQGRHEDTLGISKILIFDKHDLIHKAVGWMLREVGKKDLLIEKKFLDLNKTKMSRTTLRYAIEKFSKKDRLKYLSI